MSLFELAFFSSIISSIAILWLIPLAWRFRLVDSPCDRKQHVGEIPLIGGISIFVSTFISVLLFWEIDRALFSFLSASLLMVFIGVVDDRYDLSVKIRIIAQLAVSFILVFGSDLQIPHLGNLFSLGVIELGIFSAPFTVLAIMASMNAFNMIDGIDGLLGTLGMIAFIGIALLASLNEQFHSVGIAVVISGALIPFLIRNIGQPFFNVRKVFMGDAGSMFIGLGVLWLLTITINPELLGDSGTPVRPVAALWFVAVPVMDMCAIMVRRILKGESPFRPDRDHLHHIFLRAGFTAKEALACIACISLVLAGLGILLELMNINETIVITVFIAIFIGYCLLIKFAWKVVSWIRSIKGID